MVGQSVGLQHKQPTSSVSVRATRLAATRIYGREESLSSLGSGPPKVQLLSHELVFAWSAACQPLTLYSRWSDDVPASCVPYHPRKRTCVRRERRRECALRYVKESRRVLGLFCSIAQLPHSILSPLESTHRGGHPRLTGTMSQARNASLCSVVKGIGYQTMPQVSSHSKVCYGHNWTSQSSL